MIPRVVHRIWVGGPMPDRLAAIGDTWQQTHPDWEHRLWGDADLGWLENRDLYDRAGEIVAGHHVGQFRANLARYEILHRHGGVYVDCDLEALKPLDPLVGARAWAAWEHETGPYGPLVGNTIMAAPPGDRFVRRLIDQARVDVERYAGEPSWRMIGPAMLTRVHADHPDELVLHRRRWFYPYPTHKPEQAVGNYGDAYTAHHWFHYRTLRGRDVPKPRGRWPVRLSAAIMAHPRRAGMVDDIQRRLDRPATVVWDQNGTVWGTSRAAWLAHDPDATHHLVLQDDVVPCRDLIAGLERAVAEVPTSPIAAYTMNYRCGDRTPAYQRLLDRGVAWWRDTSSLSGQAIVVPVADIDEMVAFGDRHPRPEDDLKIRAFYRSRGVDVWNTVPSLVQHLDNHDGNATLIDGNDRRRWRRVAVAYLGEDATALDVDWSTVMVDDSPASAVERWRNSRTGQVVPVEAGSRQARRMRKLRSWVQLDQPASQPPAEPPTAPPADPEPQPAVAPPQPLGGGWYLLADGSKVRGRQNAGI